jgi:hypothetical protein
MYASYEKKTLSRTKASFDGKTRLKKMERKTQYKEEKM